MISFHAGSPRRKASFPIAVLLMALLCGGCTPSASHEAAPSSAPQDAAPEAHEDEHAELALHMAHVQRWTHKAALAVQARNQPLADFYVHELSETIETIQNEVPTYEGYAIAQLTEELLRPPLDTLAQALDGGDWPSIDARLREVATACNTCHTATDHGFIHIQVDDPDQPYLQTFAPAGN
jgi:cytochrome c553